MITQFRLLASSRRDQTCAIATVGFQEIRCAESVCVRGKMNVRFIFDFNCVATSRVSPAHAQNVDKTVPGEKSDAGELSSDPARRAVLSLQDCKRL